MVMSKLNLIEKRIRRLACRNEGETEEGRREGIKRVKEEKMERKCSRPGLKRAVGCDLLKKTTIDHRPQKDQHMGEKTEEVVVEGQGSRSL